MCRAGASQTTASPCNRACLDSLVEQVLQAMLAHNASRLPLAKGVRYSENGQFIALDDGLWGTAGKFAMPGSRDYAARFADPASGTAAYWGATNENGTMTLMRPPLPVEWKAASLGSLDSVFQSQKAETTHIPQTLRDLKFSPDCARRENAVPTNSGCAAQRNGRDSRILVADAERGVVLPVEMIDIPGTGSGSLPASQLVPGTYPQLSKIDGGSISRVESMVKWMSFGYTSVWTEPKK